MDAKHVASFCLQNANNSVQLAQTKHRLNVLAQWPDLKQAKRILEIGKLACTLFAVVEILI